MKFVDQFAADLRREVGRVICNELGHRIVGESTVLTVCTRCRETFVGGHRESYSELKLRIEEATK